MKIKKKYISLLFFGLLLCQAEYQILSIPKNVFQLSSNGGFNNYINQLGGNASPCTQFHGQPLKCNSYNKDGVDCVYSAAKVKGKVGQCRKSSARDIEKSRESARRRKTLEKQFQQS